MNLRLVSGVQRQESGRSKRRVAEKPRCVNVSAAGRRPGLGRQADRRLGALLVIALANLAFGSEPVFVFVARFKPTAFGHLVRQTANLVF